MTNTLLPPLYNRDYEIPELRREPEYRFLLCPDGAIHGCEVIHDMGIEVRVRLDYGAERVVSDGDLFKSYEEAERYYQENMQEEEV